MSLLLVPPAPGLLLVARPTLLDPNFHRTVVLIVEHGTEGTMGFVLTRQSGATIGQVADEFDESTRTEPLWVGGPVQTDTLWAIHQRRDLADLGDPVREGVWYGGAPRLVRSLLDMPAADEQGSILRLFAGYAGWGAGQLEAEIAEGAWGVVPALPTMYFNEGCDGIWEEMLLRADLPPARNPAWIENAERS